MHQPSLIAALTAALAAMPAVEAGMYLKSSPVLQLDAKNFDSHITKSNYTSIVEFYAPWCGHCQNLKPAYEKTAKNLEGLAKVAAVDCDDESNKPLCGAQGVQGFPTIKTFRPGMKSGSKPVVEDYRGPRTASGITDEVVGKINNHVTKITEGDVDGFLGATGPKAILFTEKGTTSALIRSIAIEFLDVIKVGQVRNKEKAVVEKFGIEKYPTLVLVPEGNDAKPIIYDGELKKPAMVDFLKQAGEPNPDPPSKKKGDKPKKKEEKPVEPEEAPEASSASSTTENPAATVIPISPLSDVEMLQEKCLQPKSHTCLLAIVPDEESEAAAKAVDSLSKLNAKYIHGQRHMFPFFSLPDSIASKAALRSTLDIKEDVELIAINARRSWWRHYSGGFTLDSVESWIDAIRMGEGGKHKLPSSLLVQLGEEGEEAAESKEEGETKATDPEPEDETEAPEAVDDDEIIHGEL